MTDYEKLLKAFELIESMIADFEKLEPWIGKAAPMTAKIYRDELAKLKCSLN